MGDDEKDLAEEEQRHHGRHERLQVIHTAHTLPGQGVHVQRDEQPVQQVVREHFIQALNVQAEDVVEVVQMIQVFSNKILKVEIWGKMLMLPNVLVHNIAKQLNANCL